MRVGIIGLQHESNTFIPQPTTLEDFRRGMLITGETVREKLETSHHEMGGFFEGLAKEKIEAVPLFYAAATPSGAVTDEALEAMIAMIFKGLDAAEKLDGLLVAPHGAGVGQSHPDLDGHWLERLRAKVGPKLPIVCTLDAHTNLTPAMIASVNATIVYRSNPHLDQRQRGLEAAALLGRTLRGEVRPTQAAAYPLMAINIERQHTPRKSWPTTPGRTGASSRGSTSRSRPRWTKRRRRAGRSVCSTWATTSAGARRATAR
ncbi:MAG: M81 family metallopeptidase [Planctomycetota bacterium]|nr:M81 family metallopeptidase [Planctomycetota bacterium]